MCTFYYGKTPYIPRGLRQESIAKELVKNSEFFSFLEYDDGFKYFTGFRWKPISMKKIQKKLEREHIVIKDSHLYSILGYAKKIMKKHRDNPEETLYNEALDFTRKFVVETNDQRPLWITGYTVYPSDFTICWLDQRKLRQEMFKCYTLFCNLGKNKLNRGTSYCSARFKRIAPQLLKDCFPEKAIQQSKQYASPAIEGFGLKLDSFPFVITKEEKELEEYRLHRYFGWYPELDYK